MGSPKEVRNFFTENFGTDEQSRNNIIREPLLTDEFRNLRNSSTVSIIEKGRG